jgi:glutamate transport system substrate-binding protein
MKRSLRVAFLLFASLALVLAGCGSDDDGDSGAPPVTVEKTPEFAAGTTMAKLADAGKIRIGTKFDQPGLGNISLDTEEPEGFDVEIGKLIAGKLGIGEDDIEWVETVSANREAFIASDRVDIVIATYTINDERKAQVDFAGPYYVAGQDLLVKKDDNSIKGPDDLAGKKVCATAGSTPIQRIRDSYPDAEPVEFDTYTECVDQLEADQIDAVSTDDIILAGYAADPKYDGLFRVVGETFSEEPYGIGLKKGDTAFRNFLNDTLEEAYDDGTWKSAFDATLGASGSDAPAPPAVDRY